MRAKFQRAIHSLNSCLPARSCQQIADRLSAKTGERITYKYATKVLAYARKPDSILPFRVPHVSRGKSEHNKYFALPKDAPISGLSARSNAALRLGACETALTHFTQELNQAHVLLTAADITRSPAEKRLFRKLAKVCDYAHELADEIVEKLKAS